MDYELIVATRELFVIEMKGYIILDGWCADSQSELIS